MATVEIIMLWACSCVRRSGMIACTISLSLSGDISPPPPPPPPPGTRIAEADLNLNQIQDLADLSGDIQSALVGYDLRLHLKIEISGKEPLTEETLERIQKLLKDVSEELILK
jgi:hypothetical protein